MESDPEFGGAVWSGVTGPNQTGCNSVSYDVPYNTIKGYGGTYTWDPQAQASYTVSSKGWSTYDDTADVGAKMRYVQSKGLGGLIIWSLDMDHKTGTVGQDPLLNAVKANWGTTGSGDNVPPTVAITSPGNGATVTGTISFSVNASDNVAVSSVIFKADGNQVGNLTASPYTLSYNTTSLTNGTHSLSATAYDAAGNSATASVSVTVSNTVATKDTIAPIVSITAPANNSTVTGTISITASASDNVGVASVQFKVDGSALGAALTSAPYSNSLNTTSLSNGLHAISATASDAAGNSATASVSVTVSNTVVSKDTIAPIVSITAPANNSTVTGTISITASASDNVGVASVQFKVDGSALGAALTSAPYSNSLNTTSLSNGSHAISATASDAAGNSATLSITVTVSNTVASKDTIAPTVSITAPANNSTVTGTISITASASDNVGVTSVQFKVDGSNLGSAVTTSPYVASCSTANYANGIHTISAIASDAAGNTSTSSVTVNVSNSAPPVSASNLWIYQSALSSGWSDGSWGLTTGPNYSDKQQAYTGCTASIQVVQPSNAALRILSGGWNALVPINPSQYIDVSFVVYSTSSANLSVYLMGGPSGVTFPTIKYGSIPNGQWTTVTVPVSSLDPSNQTFTMLVVQDVSGKSVTYYIDNLQLSGLPSPVLASPANGSTNDAMPTILSWNTVMGASTYRIQVSASQNFSTCAADTSIAALNVTLQSCLQCATTYYWRVDANAAGLTSQWSGVWSFTTMAPPAPPQLASPANGSTDQSLTDTLCWAASANAVRYQVELSNSASFSSTIINDSTVTSTSRITGALSANTTYYWRVQAVNSVGSSGWSSAWSFTTLSPVVSSDLTIYADALSSPWINASWSATLNFANTQHVHSGNYSISVANSAWGAASFHYGSWNSGLTLDPTLYSSVQFAVYSNSKTSFTVLLESDAGASFPQISAASTPAGTWNIITIPMSSLSPTNQKFSRVDILEMSGKAVTYYLDDIQLNGKNSAQIATDVNNNGTQQTPAALALTQNYPNPFNPTTNIVFSLPAESHVMLKVYNSLGQEVTTLVNGNMGAGIHNVVWDGSRLASGVYFYRMQAGGQVFTKKMLLIK